MRITKSQLQRLIREAISLPPVTQPVSAPSQVQLPGSEETQIDYLQDTFGGESPATVQLTQSQRFDYSPEGMDAYMQRKGIMPIDDIDAQQIVKRMGAENFPITYEVKDMISDGYILVTEMGDEFMNYIQHKADDPQGRKILMSMGSDENTVVFKERDGYNYYIYRG